MAALKASEIKYGTPLVTKIGGLLLTATQLEFPASAEYEPETAAQNLELNLEKLGLADNAPAGLTELTVRPNTAGEVASTTAKPLFSWSTPIMVTAKLANEKNKVATGSFVTFVAEVEGKLQLRIIGAPATAAVGKPLLEGTNAGKAAVGEGICTVFVIGK